MLAHESNFFRQELYRLHPIAPEAPPILDMSLSTRKPRPTKQQRLMVQYGVESAEDLPQHLRTKQYTVKKRQSMDDINTQQTPSFSMGMPGSAPSLKRGGHTPNNLNFRPPLTASAFPVKPHHAPPSHQHSASPVSTTSNNPYTAAATATALPAFGSPLHFPCDRSTTPPGNMDPGLFSNNVGLPVFIEDGVRRTSFHDPDPRPDTSHDHHSDVFGHSGSSQQSAFDTIFADLTNHDDGPEGSSLGTRSGGGHLDPALLG